MKLLAEILNSDTLNSIVTYSMLPVLCVGLILAIKIGSVWWLILLIVAILMITPLAFRRSLYWRASRRLQEATPYYKRGDANRYKGEYDRAIVEYSTAIGIDRDNARAYCTRGSVYMLKGEYDLAIADFDTAINISPNLRGLAYRSAMDRDAGEYDLANAYDDRGHAYHAKEEYDVAIADFDAAIRISHPSFDNAGTYNSRGLAYHTKRGA